MLLISIINLLETLDNDRFLISEHKSSTLEFNQKIIEKSDVAETLVKVSYIYIYTCS